jgi:hypothetical protein
VLAVAAAIAGAGAVDTEIGKDVGGGLGVGGGTGGDFCGNAIVALSPFAVALLIRFGITSSSGSSN